MTDKERVKILVKALQATLPHLPSCSEGKGEDCGPRMPYTPRCPYVKATAALYKVGSRVKGNDD